MKIIVCVKEVADPEAPAEFFTLDRKNNALVTSGKVARVLNPFDEQAVEAALRIKDKVAAKVTAVSLGKGLDRVVIKKPLFMGVDELILLEDEAFEGGDSWSIGSALAAAIKKIGAYDLILCGRQAADSNSGQVGLAIAEFLGLPSVTIARKILTIYGEKARVERVTSNGYEIVEVILPALITVSNEIGEARYSSVQNIRIANKTDPTIWKPADIGLEPTQVGERGRRQKLMKLFQPARKGTCEMVEGKTPEEAAENLALTLRKAKIM